MGPAKKKWLSLAVGAGVLLGAVVLARSPGTQPSPVGAADAGSERDEFARIVQEAFRRHGFDGTMSYDAGAFQLEVKPEGKSAIKVVLANFFEEYQAAATEEERESVLSRAVYFTQTPDVPQTYEQVESALMPVIRDRLAFERLKWRPETERYDVPTQPLGDILAVALVVDWPEAMSYVGQRELTQWGVSFEQALERALRNLRRRQGQALAVDREGVCVSPWQDNYDISRLLLREVVRSCKVKGAPVALVPNRDHLIITGSEDDAGLERALELLLPILQAPRALTGRAVRLDGETWRPFVPPPSSSAHEVFAQITNDELAGEYAVQAQWLEDEHARDGTDIFVATFAFGTEKCPDFSCATWVSNVDTLLPRTDVIIFMDRKLPPERSMVAAGRWEDAVRVVGSRMEPAGMYPERYRLKSFPTAKELKRIGNVLPPSNRRR